MKTCLIVALIGFYCNLSAVSIYAETDGEEMGKAPNVILVLTDDQGTGELGCHGNPWIKTPNLDHFYRESVRFTDFHVSPVCTPTRGALMTGRYPINNGAWATYKGRDAMSEGATTLADLFQQNGYRTGIFGKWHLGDNYPVRPTDCGFDVAVHHKAGGVGELSDYWGNTYFDDVYCVNNEPKQFKGYCTDVWFEEALKFIKETNDTRDEPFFVYLPTNAPHGPFYVDEKYAAPYKPLAGDQIVNPEFYGMITNIDENFGKLERFLNQNGLADNTILIFMTDNGTSNGISADGKIGYNHGFRGKKSSYEEGGHRVPFFIRWNNGKISGGRDIDDATAHVDLLPTLAGLCGLSILEDQTLDGVDCTPVLLQKQEHLKDRTLFVHMNQDWRPPQDVKRSCVIKNKWRLINGNQLYDIETDRQQKNNLAQTQPDLVQQLLSDNAAFIRAAKQNSEYNELPVNVVGNPNQTEIKLTIQHAVGEDSGIWKSEQVAAGMKNSNSTHSLRIDREGTYQISCRRWPKECPGPILGIPQENPKDWFTYQAISPEKVRIQIANQVLEKPVGADADEVVFNVTLAPGKTLLTNEFIEGKETYGVYYTYIKLLNDRETD